MASLKVYFTSVSSSKEIKGKQQKIFMILDSKKIDYQKIDVAEKEENKTKMRQMMEKACDTANPLPPQLFDGETYLGDYEAFEQAVEDGEVKKFLGCDCSQTEEMQQQSK